MLPRLMLLLVLSKREAVARVVAFILQYVVLLAINRKVSLRLVLVAFLSLPFFCFLLLRCSIAYRWLSARRALDADSLGAARS